ncbi:hypothetical protein ACFLVN_04060 [Chloroflexota bacterium]
MKTKKKTKVKPRKRDLPWFIWLAIALCIVAIIAFIRFFPTNGPVRLNWLGEPKAAIIDQLYNLQPNEAFISEVTKQLEDYGFEVALYQGDEVTVDLYQRLPSFGYKLIIFRAHSGLLFHKEESQIKVRKATSIFTNEAYSKIKHMKEQLNGELARARVNEYHPVVFAIGARFIRHSMDSVFNNTVIIMMGCSCLDLYDLAEAFVAEGASCYLAWDGLVDLGYVDEAGTYLVGQLCQADVTIQEAVESTMSTVGPDPNYEAALKYFPRQSGDRTLRELTE